MLRSNWKVKIGLEIHAQLRVNSKIFSETMMATTQNAKPNSAVSLFDAGYPGTLPVLNKQFVSQAIRAAMAFNCSINRLSSFERKHYFYLDMPLGYQITQQAFPIASDGTLHYRYTPDTNSGTKKKKDEGKGKGSSKAEVGSVRIERIQMEQDSGKSIHDLHPQYSVVDLNRAGVGLIEIVFRPDIETPEQAAGVLKTTQEILRHIGVCDGNLESGSMRCDVNISVSKDQTEAEAMQSKRVEVKNLNSLQRIRDAAAYESKRQIEALERGEAIVQETRAFDPVHGVTFAIREKETAVDYRYLPDPDLPAVLLTEEDVQLIQRNMPEVPVETLIRLQRQYSLTEANADLLISKQGVAYFESSWKLFCELTNQSVDSSAAAATIATDSVGGKEKEKGSKSKVAIPNATTFFFWMTGDLQGYLNLINTLYSESPLTPTQFAKVMAMHQTGKLSAPQTKNMIAALFSPAYVGTGAEPEEVAKKEGMGRITDKALILGFCRDSVFDSKHTTEWENFVGGIGRMSNFFLGDIMKRSRGTADPAIVLQTLEELKQEAKKL